MFLRGEATYRSLHQGSWLTYVHGLVRNNWADGPRLFCSACAVWLSPGSVEQITDHATSSGHMKNLRVLRARHVDDDKDHEPASKTARALSMKSKKAKPARKTVRALPMKSKTALKKPARR